jgi:hypothetical protein
MVVSAHVAAVAGGDLAVGVAALAAPDGSLWMGESQQRRGAWVPSAGTGRMSSPQGWQGGHHHVGPAHRPGDRSGRGRAVRGPDLRHAGWPAAGPARRRPDRQPGSRPRRDHQACRAPYAQARSLCFVSVSRWPLSAASGPAVCAVRLPLPRCRLSRNHVRRVSFRQGRQLRHGSTEHGECGEKARVQYRRTRCRRAAAGSPGGCLACRPQDHDALPERAWSTLDRQATYIVAAFSAGAAR